MSLKRNNFLKFFIVHNRTGKSVLAKKIASDYKKSHKGNKIISYDPQSRFTDITDIRLTEENWEKFFSKDGKELLISDALFIMDDYRGLMGSDTVKPKFMDIIMKRNEHGLDFIFICHSPKLILERLSYFITHFALFYTSGDADSFKSSKKMDNIDTIIQCREVINAYAREFGRGEYSADGNHTFPFIWIDTEDEKLNLINMPNARIKGKSISFNKINEVENLEVKETTTEATDY